MASVNIELLDALRAAGVDADTAKAAASAVLSITDKEQLATKADLYQLETRLTRTILLTMVSMTPIFGGIVAIIKIF